MTDDENPNTSDKYPVPPPDLEAVLGEERDSDE
jgi:hypothetical protein